MFDSQDLYQENVMDHNRRTRNFGSMADSTTKSEGYNPLSGHQITLFLKVSEDIVEDISFEGVGCAISKSSASMMTEGVKGKSVEEALTVFQAFRKMITSRQEHRFLMVLLRQRIFWLFKDLPQFKPTL